MVKRWLFVLAMTAAGCSEPAHVDQPDLADVGSPPEDCDALVGSEPWVTLFEPRLTRRCVIVAEHQNLQIWNKGFDSLSVTWVDGERRLGSDSFFDTGPIASVLASGPNQIFSAPYPMPVIWVLPAELSPSAGFELRDGLFGSVEPGMTVDEASDLLQVSIVVDPNLLPGPSCFGAVVVGDPYSPVFVVRADDDGSESEIVAIESELDHYRCP